MGFSRQEIKTKAKTLGSRASGTQEARRASLRQDVGVRAGWHVVKVGVRSGTQMPVFPHSHPTLAFLPFMFSHVFNGFAGG